MADHGFKAPSAAILNIFVVTNFAKPQVERPIPTITTKRITTESELPTGETTISNVDKKTPKKRKKGKRGKKNRRKRSEHDGEQDEDTDTDDELDNPQIQSGSPSIPVVTHHQYIELLPRLTNSKEAGRLVMFRSKHERELLQDKPMCAGCDDPANSVISISPMSDVFTPCGLKSHFNAITAGERFGITDRINMNFVGGPLANMKDRSTEEAFLKAVQVYGLYQPHFCTYTTFCCSKIDCTIFGTDKLHDFVHGVESKCSSHVDMNVHPHSTGFGRPVCQLCGSQDIMYCGNNCGFAWVDCTVSFNTNLDRYCSKDHQRQDRNKHKLYCNKKDEVYQKPNQVMLACHIFSGAPRKKLSYSTIVTEVPSEWIENADEFHDDLATKVTEGTNFLFRDEKGDHVDCAACGKTAQYGISFISFPLTTDNENFEEQCAEFERNLTLYHDRGAFEDTSFAAFLEHPSRDGRLSLDLVIDNFRKQVQVIPQCHVFVVPVCCQKCEDVVSIWDEDFKNGTLDLAG